MKSYLLFLFWLLYAGCFTSSAQEPFFRQIPVHGTNTGFRINALCQDTTGFIWMATNDGIWKNDGINFLSQKLPVTLTEKNITALAALPGGGIIAGTANGRLFTILNDTVQLLSVHPFEITEPISSIYAPGKNNIWFSTMGMGLFHITGSKIENYSVEDGLGDNYIYCIVPDRTGQLWVGSDGGLSYLKKTPAGKHFQNLTTNDGLPDNIIRKLALGPGNSLGIGMEEKGFCIYDIGKNQFSFKDDFLGWTHGPVTSIVKLENEFWIGTQQSGIIDFEFQAERRLRQFSEAAGFSGININALLKDHEGNIWIGAGNELYLSPGEKIEFKRQVDGIRLNVIHTILSDRNNNIWFSNDSGVYCYKKLMKSVTKLKMVTGNPHVISMYEDPYGFLWMGTFDEGVFRYDVSTGQWSRFTEKEGLINSSVLSIAGDGNELWFATLGGVSKCVLHDSLFHTQISFTSFDEQHGLGNNFIYKVYVDSKKRTWFGTDGNGITCYENGNFKNYSEADGLKSRIIYSITEDHKGNIWLSSSGEGIYRFDGKSFRNISISQGLTDLNITSLTTDNNGNIIIIHKKGIDALNPDNFYILSFGEEMGIGIIDPDVNVVDADVNGNVWIGTINGIIKLKLENRIGDKKPVLHINSVLCFLEKVDTNSVHVFAYNRNHISFDYTTLWYADYDKISYQYKLEGYNQEWITTRDRFVTFPNLRPGKYTFMLRTSVNNNFSLAETVYYHFSVKSPFWERPWFIFLLLGILIFGLYLYIRFRDEKLKTIDRIKKEKIESQYEILKNQVNPHFLFNSFNTLITVIEDDKDIAIEYVNRLSDFFRNILTYKERDLIHINEELELVENYIFLQKKRYGNNFKVEFNIPPSVRERCLIPPLALQILIENCLKHNAVSRETRLFVEVYVEDDKCLVVKNNINRKYKKEPSTGIGLQNLINRYRLIRNSELVVESTDTHFIVKLPLIKT